MSELESILPCFAALGPTVAIDEALASIPAKWGVVLLCDESHQPLQLVCTKNLRAMLRRRFDPPAEQQSLPSKRIDYRQIVRSLRWRRVDSELEMDLAYIDTARVCFPVQWRQLIPDRRAFFVQINLADAFPDFVRVADPTPEGEVFGPFLDRTKADRWIDQVRDAFDLCRYHNILVQTPDGKACAYKQMEKCPAPCDGSVPMETYRVNLDRAVSAATNSETAVGELTNQMKRQAAALEFEAAAKTKARIDLLNKLAGGANRSVRPLGVFDYLSVQPGPRKGTAKLFRLTATAATEIAALRGESFEAADVESVLAKATQATSIPTTVLLGAICHHLGIAKSAARFLPAQMLDDAALRKAVRAAMKIETTETDAETIRETALPS